MKLLLPFMLLFAVGCQVEAEKNQSLSPSPERDFFKKSAREDLTKITESMEMLSSVTSGLNAKFGLTDQSSATGYREAYEVFSSATPRTVVTYEDGTYGQTLDVESNIDGVSITLDYRASILRSGGYYTFKEKILNAKVVKDGIEATFKLSNWQFEGQSHSSSDTIIDLRYEEIGKMASFIVTGSDDDVLVFGSDSNYDLEIVNDIVTLNVVDAEIPQGDRTIRFAKWDLVYDLNQKTFSVFEVSGDVVDELGDIVGRIEYSMEQGRGVLVIQ